MDFSKIDFERYKAENYKLERKMIPEIDAALARCIDNRARELAWEAWSNLYRARDDRIRQICGFPPKEVQEVELRLGRLREKMGKRAAFKILCPKMR